MAMQIDKRQEEPRGAFLRFCSWARENTVLAMTVSTLTGFLVWMLLLLLLEAILDYRQIDVDFWAMVGALSGAVTAAALIGGGFIAYRQLIDTASARNIDVADRLFGELNSEENIAARRWIFQNLTLFGEEELEEMAQRIDQGQIVEIGEEKLAALMQKIKTEEGQEAVKRTLNSLDRVAFLTQSSLGWIPEEIIMPWMNPMIVKTWLRLKPYVERERIRRNEFDYYDDAGKLGDRSVVWRIRKYGKAVSTSSSDAI